MIVHNVCTAVCTQLCPPDLSFMTFPQVYTMWDNLHKTNGMDVGQIGFHKQKAVRKIRLASRENVIVNRLNKTKVEKQLDFRAEREGRDKKERDDKKRAFKNLEEAKKQEEKEREEAAKQRSKKRRSER